MGAVAERGGETFDAGRDGDRLDRQHAEVYALMHDGQWRTLSEISRTTGHPEASVSARLRDFRKPKHGSHVVERRYWVNGLWCYRLIVSTSAA
jgi:hypothetical protein